MAQGLGFTWGVRWKDFWNVRYQDLSTGISKLQWTLQCDAEIQVEQVIGPWVDKQHQ